MEEPVHSQYGLWPLVVLNFALFVGFPVLAAMYLRLAGREERAPNDQFGEAYYRYAARTPACIPRPASLVRARGLQSQQGS